MNNEPVEAGLPAYMFRKRATQAETKRLTEETWGIKNPWGKSCTNCKFRKKGVKTNAKKRR